MTDKIQHFIDVGSNLTGSVTGAAIGMVVAGPPGALAGAIAGPAIAEAIKKIGSDIRERFLGPREEQRIGAALIFAGNKIKQNIDAGLEVRSDDFIQNDENGRKPVDEILEGVLLSAQREYEEQKLILQGNLFGNIIFDTVDRSTANFLIRLSERLTYRQLCLLSIFGRREKFQLYNRTWRSDDPSMTPELSILLQELFDMISRGVIAAGSSDSGRMSVNAHHSQIHGAGIILYRLMELNSIPENVLNPLVALLNTKA